MTKPLILNRQIWSIGSDSLEMGQVLIRRAWSTWPFYNLNSPPPPSNTSAANGEQGDQVHCPSMFAGGRAGPVTDQRWDECPCLEGWLQWVVWCLTMPHPKCSHLYLWYQELPNCKTETWYLPALPPPRSAVCCIWPFQVRGWKATSHPSSTYCDVTTMVIKAWPPRALQHWTLQL